MTRSERAGGQTSHRLVAVTLDEASIGRSGPDIEHERAVAIYDLLEDNTFAPLDAERGPFKLHLSIRGSRLVPLKELAARAAELAEHKHTDIVTICRSGMRSTTAAV